MRIFRKFLEDKKGSVAITFGVAAVPIVLSMGIALDYVQASQLQSKMLLAADSAGLAAGASEETDAIELKKIVNKYLKKNGAMAGNISKPKVEVESLKNGNLKVSVSAKMNTTVMRIIGRKTVEISATTIIARDYGDLDVVLVLDNTGSMRGRKLQTLKSASVELVNSLNSSKGANGKIKIGLVPFSNYVNIGVENRKKPWADIQDDKHIDTIGYRWKYLTDEKECHIERTPSYSDGILGERVRNVCVPLGPRVQEAYTRRHSVYWSGCMGSRDYPWNTRDERPDHKIPPIINHLRCFRTNPLTNLTDDKSLIIGKLNGMKEFGSTYIPTGLMWGWRVISSGMPFDNVSKVSAGGNKSQQRAIVLMTDGENTVSPSYPSHNGNNKTTADRLTAEICENIKKSKEEIIIYTVAFEVEDVSTRDMLRSCATSPSYFFNADNSAKLITAFQKIARSLSLLRIAQ